MSESLFATCVYMKEREGGGRVRKGDRERERESMNHLILLHTIFSCSHRCGSDQLEISHSRRQHHLQ